MTGGTTSSGTAMSGSTVSRATIDTETSSASALGTAVSNVVAAAALGGAINHRSPVLACVALGSVAGVFGADQQCAGVVRVTAIAGKTAIGTLNQCPEFTQYELTVVSSTSSAGPQTAQIGGDWSWQPGPVCGRPLFVANQSEPVVATVSIAGKSSRDAGANAARWINQAQGEHASVASFATFSLQLMINGAPFSLLSGAALANADEVRHAEQSLALASRFAGAEVTLDAFPAVAVTDLRPQTIGDLAEAVLREGCVGETLSVLDSARQVDEGVDMDELERTVLHGIVRDELKHSALAWRTLAWASRDGGTLVDRLRGVVDELSVQYKSTEFDRLVRPLTRCLVGNARWSEIVETTDAPLDGNAASLHAEAIRTLLATFSKFDC